MSALVVSESGGVSVWGWRVVNVPCDVMRRRPCVCVSVRAPCASVNDAIMCLRERDARVLRRASRYNDISSDTESETVR